MSNKNIFLMNGETGKLMEFGKVDLPALKTENNVQWVIFGADPEWYNQYPQYIDYLSKTSAKNGAILKAKTRFVYGKGWDIDRTNLTPAEIIEARSFIAKIEQGKVTKKNIGDKQKFGGFCAEMIPSKDGEYWTPKYLPFKNVRVSPTSYNPDKTEQPKVYYYTSDWSKKAKSKENKDFQEFHPFPWDKEKIDKSKRYIVYYKDDEYDLDAYPLPNYIQGVPYIDADSNVGNFIKHNADNAFSAGYLVNFYNGDPDDEQKDEISDAFDGVLTGSKNAGKVVKAFNEANDKGVEITPIVPNGQDERYVTLNNQIRDEIYTAHTISPLVTGMKGDNGFSNNADEKRQAKEDFIEDYATPQQEPHNDFMNAVFRFNGIKGVPMLTRIPMAKPQISQQEINLIATTDEKREMAGLPKKKEVENPVLTALNSVSPLVANKILESMTLAEIRNLVTLKTDSAGVSSTTAITSKNFSSDQDAEIIQAFSECGVEDSELICFDKRELPYTDTFGALSHAKVFKHDFTSKIESAVLKIISAEPKITPGAIGEIIGEPASTISDIISTLESNGLVSNGEITEAGKTDLDENQIFVVYKYALRADAEPLKGGESRPFCREMMKLSQTRSWTIEQIQTISNRVGYDVFSRRGGWYTLPDTNKHLPYCRHVFEQRLVRKK